MKVSILANLGHGGPTNAKFCRGNPWSWTVIQTGSNSAQINPCIVVIFLSNSMKQLETSIYQITCQPPAAAEVWRQICDIRTSRNRHRRKFAASAPRSMVKASHNHYDGNPASSILPTSAMSLNPMASDEEIKFHLSDSLSSSIDVNIHPICTPILQQLSQTSNSRRQHTVREST